MISFVTRREMLQQVGSAAGAALLGGGILRGQDQDYIVAGKPAEIQVTPISRLTVRIGIVPIQQGMPATIPGDGSLIQSAWGRPKTRRGTRAGDDRLRCGDLEVRVAGNPPVITIAAGKRPVQELKLNRDTGEISFRLGRGPILGFGQGGPQFDRRGSVDRMRSGQGGYRLRTHGGRVPMQWLIGTEGWAMFIHQPLGSYDLTSAEGRFTPFANSAGLLDLFIVGSTDPIKILGEYALLTGKPELPPLWSFGYMQSHRTLAGPDEILWVARTFREKKLPCDALIYLGTGFTPSGWNTNNGEFAFNPKTFPDPEGMIAELHKEHFRVVLHAVLEGRRLTGTVHDVCENPPKPGETGSGRNWPDAQKVACYWPIHRRTFALGVDGWWPDQGDGLDAESRLARIRMYWEGCLLERPNERPFALHRNGHSGMQRHAAFLWSGDVYSTWETLKTHVPVAVNCGLSGIPYWGTDIGGFVPTPEYTGELHVRWFQFGAFCPLFRAHGRTWHLRLPWGWNTGKLGPSEVTGYTGGAGHPDPSELRNPSVEPICRKYLELRYRLMPYLYTAVRDGCDSGLPVLRAMWLHYPHEPAAVSRGDQFLWGRDILVAPVVEKGAVSRKLYLPRGSWFDFWTEERIEGEGDIERAVDLSTMPLYVRAGSILPLGPARQYTDEPVGGPLTLQIYPGADGDATMYEDDGRTFNHRRGEWMRLAMSWKDRSRRLQLRLAPGSKMLPPMRREIEVRLVGQSVSKRLVFDGSPATVRL